MVLQCLHFLNYHHLRLEKFGDDNLLALFSKDYNFKLYSINTKTLKFTEVEGFNKLKINKNRTVNLLKWDNDFLLIGTTGNVSAQGIAADNHYQIPDC